jgi:hypothetical protein
MFLPESIAQIIAALEKAGYAAYVVGGCVRDACLGLTPHDYDLCTSALPEQTEAVFRKIDRIIQIQIDFAHITCRDLLPMTAVVAAGNIHLTHGHDGFPCVADLQSLGSFRLGGCGLAVAAAGAQTQHHDGSKQNAK